MGGGCSAESSWLGCPDTENTGTEIVITDERPGGSLPDDWRPNDDDSSAPPDTTPQPPTPPREDNCSPANPTTCFEQPGQPDEPAIPQPTLADVPYPVIMQPSLVVEFYAKNG